MPVPILSVPAASANRPVVCAHRGAAGGNIPCNTMAAFEAALAQGADMIELDAAKSRDGVLFVFHPGMEAVHLRSERRLSEMDAAEVEELRYVNADGRKTPYGVDRLETVLRQLKDRCLIYVDKFETDIPGIAREIRRAGVRDTAVIQPGPIGPVLRQIEEYASDLMVMPLILGEDTVTEELRRRRKIRLIGTEVLFDREDAPAASPEYVENMHRKGLWVTVNALSGCSSSVLAAGHDDDRSVTGDPEGGWGWLADRGFDMFQTDWCGLLRRFLENRTTRRIRAR